ncbi:MAG TPA: hypothetical protein VHD83_10955 [Puia sp.]|nr:hypothetical protein [Puia sp.]
MKRILLFLILPFLGYPLLAQKNVFTYPFEFEKSFLQKSDYDAFFLDDQTGEAFAFVLRDNKKVSYAMADKKFKIASQFSKQLGETLFGHSDYSYLGGTVDKNIYHYIYKEKEKKVYMEENVDFEAKSISNKQLFEIPKEEQLLISFSDHNRYFTITANKKTSDLQFYEVSYTGEASTKTVHFNIPPIKKDKIGLSDYLANLKLVKEGEEPGLNIATQKAKLFCHADRLEFLVNVDANPTHIFTLDLNTFTATEKFFDHSDMEDKEGKGKSYISSFLKDGKLFTLILNKKDIRLAVYDQHSGALINKTVLTDDDALASLAQPPVSESRMGNKRNATDVDNFKKVVAAFKTGTEGITVSTNKSGQYVLQVGTYDPIQTSSGGGWQGGYQHNPAFVSSAATPSVMPYTYNPMLLYYPGVSSYMSTSARYYRTLYFKMLLDPTTLKPVRGRVPESIGDQIKDFVDDTDKKAKATKQFNMDGKEYYGYYDKDQTAYVIQEIMIRK